MSISMECGILSSQSVASDRVHSEAREGVELQFSAVLLRVESRPRSSAHAVHASLGAVVLRDRVTPDTLFPVLVAPQVQHFSFIVLTAFHFADIC